MFERLRDGIEGPAGSGAAESVEGLGESAARDDVETSSAPRGRRLTGRREGSPARVDEESERRSTLTAEERFLVLDAWKRSGLPGGEFAKIVQVSAHTLNAWRRRFDEMGPEGLSDHPRGAPKGSRLPEATRRAILLMKESHPEWGTERIHAMLLRGEGFAASAGAILRVLDEAGYESADLPTSPHPDRPHFFERAKPNQLWQSDLFTFMLKRENRRVHLVVFMDDHSRFIVGYGLHATASGALVREVLEAGIRNFGAPEEVLTDNGPQYVTWRGRSAFTRLLDRRGIRHVVSRPRHPQTLGKTERFWGTLWRECAERAIFQSLDDARRRVGLFIDYYNFQRTNQGIENLVPADRYFEAAPEVQKALAARVAANAVDLARDGVPRQAFYLAGRVAGEGISLHGEGGKVILTRTDGHREEVDLEATGRRGEPGEAFAWPTPVAVTCGPEVVLDGAESEEEEDTPAAGSPDVEGEKPLEAGAADEGAKP
ncbi:MAG: DDE-type integrase/transposase/recombinase [Acidobacteriia bacterium]|nr:DDE-type integrase/transposase/recombinase [Terriglobia bacterium]